MDHNFYLTHIPQDMEKYGFCKTLAVRREVINLKHVMTECFVRKTIDIEEQLSFLGKDLFWYVTYMTNRLRKIHKFSREYNNNLNDIVKTPSDSFTKMLKLYSGLNNIVILDFDGVVTSNNFKPLYEYIHTLNKVVICTANPTVTNEWFEKRNLPLPSKIYANKGKIKKIISLSMIMSIYDNAFYIDNEIEYLKFAWLFGIKTFHWDQNKIKYFSMKSK